MVNPIQLKHHKAFPSDHQDSRLVLHGSAMPWYPGHPQMVTGRLATSARLRRPGLAVSQAAASSAVQCGTWAVVRKRYWWHTWVIYIYNMIWYDRNMHGIIWLILNTHTQRFWRLFLFFYVLLFLMCIIYIYIHGLIWFQKGLWWDNNWTLMGCTLWEWNMVTWFAGKSRIYLARWFSHWNFQFVRFFFPLPEATIESGLKP